MKNLKVSFAAAFMLFAGLAAKAQQDAMYTHYMYNTLSVNPAYAGSRDALTITGLHRSQWAGFEGAPVTQTLTLHAPVKSRHLGLGLSVVNDKIGPVNNTGMWADFAYVMKTSEKGRLGLGLKGGVSMMQSRLSSLELDQQNDNAFMNDIQSRMLPNFGFGAYYYLPRFYAGLSVPRLLENDYAKNTSSGGTDLGSEKRHYYFITGAMLKVSNSIDLKPTTLVKVTAGAPVEADITGTFIFNERLLLGAMYRTGDAAGLILGMNINEQFRVGYSYDWSFGNKTLKYNYGSHEIMLSYDFIYKDEGRIRSPRHF